MVEQSENTQAGHEADRCNYFGEQMNIVLTGFMATGKSTVGKKLAEKLGWQYVDTDEIIEHEIGMKIAEIFDKRGEPFFRDVETRAARFASKKK
ncbi:MAG: shikimate kinase [Elusimicrobiota bacterium]